MNLYYIISYHIISYCMYACIYIYICIYKDYHHYYIILYRIRYVLVCFPGVGCRTSAVASAGRPRAEAARRHVLQLMNN